MSFEIFLGFVLATAVFVVIPGPNVTLIIANSLSRGTRAGLMTVVGTNTAIVLQLIALVMGAGSLLLILSDWFNVIRWLGVAYLVYLGIRIFLDNDVVEPSEDNLSSSSRKEFWHGFFVAFTNPKIMVFLAAFFPQFIDPNGSIFQQMSLLAATFLGVGTAIESLWALTAGRASRMLARFRRVQNRIIGALYITTAAGLALMRRNPS